MDGDGTGQIDITRMKTRRHTLGLALKPGIGDLCVGRSKRNRVGDTCRGPVEHLPKAFGSLPPSIHRRNDDSAILPRSREDLFAGGLRVAQGRPEQPVLKVQKSDRTILRQVFRVVEGTRDDPVPLLGQHEVQVVFRPTVQELARPDRQIARPHGFGRGKLVDGNEGTLPPFEQGLHQRRGLVRDHPPEATFKIPPIGGEGRSRLVRQIERQGVREGPDHPKRRVERLPALGLEPGRYARRSGEGRKTQAVECGQDTELGCAAGRRELLQLRSAGREAALDEMSEVTAGVVEQNTVFGDAGRIGKAFDKRFGVSR